MSDQFQHMRLAGNADNIKFILDPARSPREQIEAVLASVKSRVCELHPQEILPVNMTAAIADILHHDYPYEERPCQAEFTATYERCSKCPHNDAGHDIEVENCAVFCPSFFKHGISRDEKRKPLPKYSGTANFKADLCASAQFDAWLANLGEVRCKLTNEVLRRRDARLTLPFEAWTVKPQFARCVQCCLERLGIAPDDSRASLDNFMVQPSALQMHLDTCRAFTAAPKGVLLLLGNCGTGKTHLAIAILREHLRRGAWGPVFIKHRHFLAEHWHSLRPVPFDEEPPESPLRRCQESSLLVYDELTANTDGRPYEDVMLDLFEQRISSFKPSIITANVSPGELEAVLGSRLHDRLRRAAFAVLEFGFDSKRKSLNDDYLLRSRSSGRT